MQVRLRDAMEEELCIDREADEISCESGKKRAPNACASEIRRGRAIARAAAALRSSVSKPAGVPEGLNPPVSTALEG